METTHEWRDLLVPEEMEKWSLNAWRPKAKLWTLEDGIYSGFCSGGHVVYREEMTDFALKTEFLYERSHGGGSLVLRVGLNSIPWEVGYRLALNMAEDDIHGRLWLHLPQEPSSPYSYEKLHFTVNEWHSLSVEVRGATIKVALDGKAPMMVTDPNHRFKCGHISLGDEPCEPGDTCEGRGHTKYRNLRIRKL